MAQEQFIVDETIVLAGVPCVKETIQGYVALREFIKKYPARPLRFLANSSGARSCWLLASYQLLLASASCFKLLPTTTYYKLLGT